MTEHQATNCADLVKEGKTPWEVLRTYSCYTRVQQYDNPNETALGFAQLLQLNVIYRVSLGGELEIWIPNND